jgi:hypothetical protein
VARAVDAHRYGTRLIRIREGRAAKLTAGTLADSRTMDPAGAVVRTLIGPSSRGLNRA